MLLLGCTGVMFTVCIATSLSLHCLYAISSYCTYHNIMYMNAGRYSHSFSVLSLTLTPERLIGVGESVSTLIRCMECDRRNFKEDLKHDDRPTDRPRDDLARYVVQKIYDSTGIVCTSKRVRR